MSEIDASAGSGPPGSEPIGKRIYILTGLSGAGKSLVSRILEDQGFFCVDNLPPELLEKFVELTLESARKDRPVLLVCDVRSTGEFDALLGGLERLEKRGIRHLIMYLEATTPVVIRRFSETRRRHPLLGGTLPETIERERQLLEPLRQAADLVLDTSTFSVPQLRRHVLSLLKFTQWSTRRLNVVLSSFGFKHGLPPEADLVFDVRFLPNPRYVESLAPLTGLERRVSGFVFGHLLTRRFVRQLSRFLEFLIPCYVEEGKSHLTIGIGCTGGQHRSVAIVEELARRLVSLDVHVIRAHRDLERDAPPPSRSVAA